jgi:hypothetical protein
MEPEGYTTVVTAAPERRQPNDINTPSSNVNRVLSHNTVFHVVLLADFPTKII